MSPGCCPLVFFLLLTADNVPAVTPSQHEGEGRKFTLAPTTCFHEHVSPIPPIVRRLTLPPASWYAAWWQDLHRGILWNLCKLALMLKCVCVCVEMFWLERNKSFFSLSSRIYLKQSKDQGLSFVHQASLDALTVLLMKYWGWMKMEASVSLSHLNASVALTSLCNQPKLTLRSSFIGT